MALIPIVAVPLVALEASFADTLVLAVLMSGPAAAGLRMARTGLFPTPDRLHVVNFLSTKTYRWSDIDRFETRTYPSGAVLIDNDGREHGLFALQKRNPVLLGNDTRVDELVAS